MVGSVVLYDRVAGQIPPKLTQVLPPSAATCRRRLAPALQILVGLFVVCLSVRAFFWKPAAHDDALQQLRAAKQAQHGYGDSVSATLQQFCEEHFGMEWLRRWGSAAQQVCSATQKLHAASIGTDGSWSRVTCRSMNDSHMPAASAPHVLCDATNLRLDPSKLVRRPASRLMSLHISAWAADGRPNPLYQTPAVLPCNLAAPGPLPEEPPWLLVHLPHLPPL